MKTELYNSMRSIGVISLSIGVLVSGLSCSTGDDPLLGMLERQYSNVKIDSLSRTMNFVVSPDRFQKAQFEEKLAASLNRWGDAESDLFAKSEWQPDTAIGDITQEFNDLPVVKDIELMGFTNTDAYFLQQNYWSKKLAERIVAIRNLGPFEVIRIASGIEASDVDADDDPLSVALAKIHGDLVPSQSDELSKSLKAFDWVIRNIMLLPDQGVINEETTAEDLRLQDADTYAESGIPGLGYTRFPAQTMLTSRGDYVDRAKLFMMMLFQLEIDAVMLAVDSDDGGTMPWAVGVHIGDELFLFDTKLGLPIPGESLGSIATFNDVVADPGLLKSLDLSVNESLKDDTQYWVDAEQLRNVNGLIYCPPESVSYRFWELENKLVGDARMLLTVQPSELIKSLPQIDGMNYKIWDIEFQTHQFRRVLRDAIAEASFRDPVRDKIRWYYADESYIDQFVRYRTARSKYFHGLFETIRNDGNLNAIELFYSMIYKESKIDSLATDIMFQRSLAIDRGKMSAAEFENVIRGVQANMRLVRRDSGYFLSQCHFDNGNFSISANWLTRLEALEDTARWQQAINYLKARSLEAQRDYASAVDIYLKQDAEHYHGDLIRVRQLKELIGDFVTAPETDSDADQTEALSDEDDSQTQASDNTTSEDSDVDGIDNEAESAEGSVSESDEQVEEGDDSSNI